MQQPAVPTTTTALYDALDELARLGPTGDPRVCTALLRALARVEGLALREVATVDAYGTAAELGQVSTAALVQAATRSTIRSAQTTVRLANRLDQDLQPLGEALVAGRLSRRHCEATAYGVRGLGAQVVADAVPAILDLALLVDPDVLARELRTRAEAISPELAQEARRRLDARVGVGLDESPDGTGHLTGTLSAETLALFRAVLDGLVHGQRVEGDLRSAPRRRHDALLDVLRHAADCDGLDVPAQGGTRAQVTVVADAATVCGFEGARPATVIGTSHGLLTRGELLRVLCDADVSTVHLSDDLERLDLSRLTRTVTRAQWRALLARDGECVVRGCHRRPAQCQAHHVVHWADGGSSDLANLALLCHRHHHDVHDRQRWLDCAGGRVMTSAGWLDPGLAEPLVGSASGPPR